MIKTVKCIVCEHEIKSVRDEGEKNPDFAPPDNYDELVATMWHGGTCDMIYPGYGSRRDTSKIRIALCDDCLDKKINSGVAQHVGYYC